MRSWELDDDLLMPFRRLHRGATSRPAVQAVLDSVAGERPLAQPQGDRLLLAGDWHGNTIMARRAIEVVAAGHGVSTVVQLGDFGLWHGDGGEGYLDVLSTVCSGLDITLLIVDGNHEDFHTLDRYPVTPEGPAAGLRVIRPHLYHLPRGFRWTWRAPDGTPVRWLAVGGAASVDAGSRTPELDWWPQEQLTEAQAATIADAGTADVVVCHDRPKAAASMLGDPPGVWHDRGRKLGWLTEHLIDSDLHSARLQRVLDAVRPRAVYHGHLHARTNVLIDGDWGQYRVQGLSSDAEPGGNTLLVSTSGAQTR